MPYLISSFSESPKPLPYESRFIEQDAYLLQIIATEVNSYGSINQSLSANPLNAAEQYAKQLRSFPYKGIPGVSFFVDYDPKGKSQLVLSMVSEDIERKKFETKIPLAEALVALKDHPDEFKSSVEGNLEHLIQQVYPEPTPKKPRLYQ